MFHHAAPRGLTTLLFTDIAGSTEVVVQLGDSRWRAIQSRHHAEVRRELKRYGGHEVDTAGDGFLATFSSPADGVRCAFAIVKAVRELGLEVRAGLHIGEAELAGEKVSGIAVTTAARVSAMAGPGQILVTSTIVQMVAGSNLEFSRVGTRELKGIPGTWELFALAAVGNQPIGVPLDTQDAAEARERSSPAETRERARLRALLVGIGIVSVVALTGAVLFQRDRSGSTVTQTASGHAPVALVALDDGSGADAFPVDLPTLPTPLVGPLLLTGRLDSPSAFAWLPFGVRTYGLHVAQINRASGAVVDNGSGFEFNTPRTTCVCAATAEGRIWTPIATGKSPTGLFQGSGVSLRGIDLEGESTTDIVVDRTLVSGGIAALVSGGGYLWVGDSTYGRVYRVDPRTLRVKRFALRQSADVLVFEDGTLFVLDSLEGKITRVDPSTGRSLPSFTISGDLQGMAAGGGYLWVTDASGNEVQRIPEDLGSASTAIPVGQFGGSPKGIAYDDGAVVIGFTNGTVSKINPSNPSSPGVVWTRPGLGIDGSSISIDGGIVWAGGGPTTNY